MAVSIKEGDRFHKLLVEGHNGVNNRKEHLWKCRCDCGNSTTVKSYNLRSGKTKSCGCAHKLGPSRSLIHVGKRYGRLQITGFSHMDRHRTAMFDYTCDCGNTGVVRLSALRVCKSCGCYNRDSKETGHMEISGTSWGAIVNSAKHRGLYLSITIEDLWSLYLIQDRLCAISGVPVWFGECSTMSDQTASLDRIDSGLGYTKDNIQVVHKDVNIMKGILSNQELIDWCHLIAAKSKGRSCSPTE
jgi:hypothetical protein